MSFLKRIFGKPSSSTNIKSQQFAPSVDEDYINYILSNNPTVTRDDMIAFFSVLNVFDNTANKEKTLDAFDFFINQLASSNPLHAMRVNGFFCGLLGANISLSDMEVSSLAQKNTPMIIAKLNKEA